MSEQPVLPDPETGEVVGQLPLFELDAEQQPILPEEEQPVEEPGGILIERDKAIYP
jgi:hypothetical protein